jgi:hypothetical protein
MLSWPELALVARGPAYCKALFVVGVQPHRSDDDRCALLDASTPVNGTALRNL